MGVFLVICGLIGIGARAFAKSMSQADDEGVFKTATKSAAIRLIEKFIK